MPRKIIFDPEPIEPAHGGRLLPELIYTFRPTSEDGELVALGDQSDETYLSFPLQFPIEVDQSFGSTLGVATGPELPLINYIKVYVRGTVIAPASGEYSAAKVYVASPTATTLVDVADWPENQYGVRESGELALDPDGEEWTIAKIVTNMEYGGRCHIAGRIATPQPESRSLLPGPTPVTPFPEFRVSEVMVEVYGIAAAELPTRKFETGVYGLLLEEQPLKTAALTVEEARSLHVTATRSRRALSLTVLALDSGDIGVVGAITPNSTYDAMIAAILDGGSTPPEEV